MLRNRPPLRTAVVIEIIALATIAAYFLPGGEDLYRFYLPLAQGCFDCAYNPWHASWLLFPMTLIPQRILWAVWVFVTLTGIVWSCSKLNVNPVPVLLSFPTMGLIWLGQADVLIAVGLVLACISPNPYLRGFGLLLASVKPHIAAIPALILLIHDSERWKTLILPATVAAISLVVWGMDWPLRWFAQRDPLAALPVWGTAALVPYGLVAFGAVFLAKGSREKVTAALLASALAFPWFGVYSYTVFLVFFAPVWAVFVSYAWLVAYPLYGNLSMKFAWILPLSLLIALLWPTLTELWHRFRKGTAITASNEPTNRPVDDPPAV
jgi:hypothetical protein